jgi:uncharacterized membrane protein
MKMADTNNLVVLSFEGMGTAAAVYEQLEQMEKEQLLEIEDAIIVERDAGEASGRLMPSTPGTTGGGVVPIAGSPDANVRIVQTHGKKGKFAAGGAGIGLLAGFLLGGPVGGLIVGAGLGAITAALKDFGIDDKSITAIKARLTPDSSALMVLGRAEDRDALIARLRAYDPTVVSTTLTPEVEKELRDRLAG